MTPQEQESLYSKLLDKIRGQVRARKASLPRIIELKMLDEWSLTDEQHAELRDLLHRFELLWASHSQTELNKPSIVMSVACYRSDLDASNLVFAPMFAHFIARFEKLCSRKGGMENI